MLVNISFDTAILKQTIIARDYIETTAIYIDEISNEEDSMFYDCIYSFKDNQGKQHEIIVSVFEGNVPSDEIKVKYNESNPEDYYEVGSTFDKLGIIKYLVKIIVIILLIVLFFNKTLLNKINISSSRRE